MIYLKTKNFIELENGSKESQTKSSANILATDLAKTSLVFGLGGIIFLIICFISPKSTGVDFLVGFLYLGSSIVLLVGVLLGGISIVLNLWNTESLASNLKNSWLAFLGILTCIAPVICLVFNS